MCISPVFSFSWLCLPGSACPDLALKSATPVASTSPTSQATTTYNSSDNPASKLMATSINIARIAFVLFVGVLTMTPITSGLDSCASALQPIFSGAQGYRCVQLTLTTASASTSAVWIPLQ
jgi:hypothetical protein